MYRIDQLGTASTCTSRGTTSIYYKIHLVADMGRYCDITSRWRKMVERERSDFLVFKLAAVALPIDAGPSSNITHPCRHTVKRDSAACLSIYNRISMR
jgi:hypothetical protein